MDATTTPRRPLKDRLLERTSPVRQASRGQPYNYPPLWYCKSDGDIVQLPGDPQNRAYFEDKGYAVLRHDEVLEWEQVLRPRWIEETREKAALISTIRRVGSKHPGVEIVDNLDELSVDDLKEFLEDLGKVTGAPVKVLAKRFGVEADRVPDDVGVPVRSGAELASKIARGAARAGG
jgi:hypothetical protein